jgi:glycolate oxidase iron-sulfur subunit
LSDAVIDEQGAAMSAADLVATRRGTGKAGDLGTEIARLAFACVGCGLCNAKCPTYLLTGDEREGPRGRIGLISDLAGGHGQPAIAAAVSGHLDRCLSCHACGEVCPTGVRYERLVAQGRKLLRGARAQPFTLRLIERVAGQVIPFPDRLRWYLRFAPAVMRGARLIGIGRSGPLRRIARQLNGLAAERGAFVGPGTAKTKRERRGRVILLAGCAGQVLRPSITDAAIRVLARNGLDVEVVAGAGCCGATRAEQGDEAGAQELARANVDAWSKSLSRASADAIVTTAGGCGAMVRDYGYLLRDDPAYSERAGEIADLAVDVTAFADRFGLAPPLRWSTLRVACHKACSLAANGGGAAQRDMVHRAGFSLVDAAPGQICCGGKGTFPYRESEIADTLRRQTAEEISRTKADVVATGSLACLKHLEGEVSQPVVHTIELIDWAHGGPVPPGLEHLAGEIEDVPGARHLDVDDFLSA